MPVKAVVGAQWGDEGKGKIVDFLAGTSDMVVRFQGGPNAGHTIVNEYGTFQLHGIPSGIFRSNVHNIAGPGCVISPEGILKEIKTIEDIGISTRNLYLSDRAHVIMPYHYIQEELEETALGNRNIGTTRRGIGPSYADKYGRWGIRLGDLLHESWLAGRLNAILSYKNRYLQAMQADPFEFESLMTLCKSWLENLKPYICDTLPIIHQALKSDKNILLEGQLGIGKGIEWGSYPFVTSSSPIAGYASAGAGIPPYRIDEIIGVVKAYSTSVGAGPMVTKDETGIGPELRRLGHEYGATTGRPRHCGWLDTIILKYGAMVNGYTSFAMTRLDVMNSLETIGICTAYRYKGELLHDMPITPILEECEPVYDFIPGWNCSLEGIRRMEDLPKAARAYIDRIVDCIEAPVSLVSTGPEREKMIVV